jgi:tRNA-splicing ligase RtcB
MYQKMGKIKVFADTSTVEVLKSLQQFQDFINGSDKIVDAALMPDCHQGYSVPIGAVFASRDVVFPSAVGYDIGCGMCAIPTTWKFYDVYGEARKIHNNILEKVPVGYNHNTSQVSWPAYKKIEKTEVADKIFNDKDGTGFKQLGTLGGGNHFIEVGAGDDGRVWVIIHSGSRNIGHKIGTHYMKIAGGGKCREGHYALSINSVDGFHYWIDMNFGLEFALENRIQMLRKIETAMSDALAIKGKFLWDEMINRNHNHATVREYNGEDVIIHRKGATHAEKDMYGVIPGNMRDGSFIVRGKGNPDSLYSSSHGAGRVLGRKAAKEQLSVEEFRTTMKGIVSTTNKSTLDESPMAYKNIFEVMELQKDLVEVVAHVKPILNVKG